MASYALLKKPYSPVVFTSAAATFKVYGKSFMQLQAVYLSGAPYINQTFYNPFSAVRKLSADYPGFFAVKLLSSQYTTNFDNTVTFTLPSAVNPGYVDIIIQNPAGYGSLRQYAVRELYSGQQTQAQIRPWALGIEVLSGIKVPPLPANIMYSLSTGSVIVTFNGKGIVTFAVGLSDQMYSLNNDFIVSIQGDNIITI